MQSEKCTVAIQAFTSERVEIQVRNGTNLLDIHVLSNGQEKLIEIGAAYTVTINRVRTGTPLNNDWVKN